MICPSCLMSFEPTTASPTHSCPGYHTDPPELSALRSRVAELEVLLGEIRNGPLRDHDCDDAGRCADWCVACRIDSALSRAGKGTTTNSPCPTTPTLTTPAPEGFGKDTDTNPSYTPDPTSYTPHDARGTQALPPATSMRNEALEEAIAAAQKVADDPRNIGEDCRSGHDAYILGARAAIAAIRALKGKRP